MKRVYKYAVKPNRFQHRMTTRTDLLWVAMQGDQPQMWALVDLDAPEQWRHFAVVGTGFDVDERIVRHVGTFLMADDTLVWHVFEIEP